MTAATKEKSINRWYGWRPDKPDFRDHPFTLRLEAKDLPNKTDLTPSCPPVQDQGALGSCTANAIAEAIEFDRMKQKLKPWLPSRLFIYYQERVIEGTVKEDAGAEIRDGIKSVNQQGAPPESSWPYVIKKFAQKPPKKAYTSAVGHKALAYQRLDSGKVSAGTLLNSMKSCLASGYPFVGGFTVYESFESDEVAKTGIVPMPSKDEGVLGGHAILIIGFDDDSGRLLVRNSWGEDWGIKGNFTIPYEYFTDSDLASDFWKITNVK